VVTALTKACVIIKIISTINTSTLQPTLSKKEYSFEESKIFL
jgi:hypothetical protein